MKYLFISFLFCIAVDSVTSSASFPEYLQQLKEDGEYVVTQLASEVVRVHESRTRYLNRCSCSRHWCTTKLGKSKCSTEYGDRKDVCGKNCKGRRIIFDSSTIGTPPDVNLNFLEDHLKQSICLYSHVERKMKHLFKKKKRSSWLYFASVDGTFRIYPSPTRERNYTDEDTSLNTCKEFDPRRRQWFKDASTGPKDVVILLDVSESMEEPIARGFSQTRWSATKGLVSAVLDTLSSSDYVNLVTFADTANRLGKKNLLFRGTEENLNDLKGMLENQTVDGTRTNFVNAFREGFDLLARGCDEQIERPTCSGCHKIILFVTDGRDTTGPNAKGIEASEMLQQIEEEQQMLLERGTGKARIFTYSIGSTADDSIPRQLACAHGGTWSFVKPFTDPLSALRGYYLFLANYDLDDSMTWSGKYVDFEGMGSITTISKPVFSKAPSKKAEGVLLGVVGHDILTKDLEREGIPAETILTNWITGTRRCDELSEQPCELQYRRKLHGDKAVCADTIASKNETTTSPILTLKEKECFKKSGKYYQLFLEQKSWADASKECEDYNGTLAVIESDDELAVVAGVSSPDGSWIGAQRNPSSRQLEWIDKKISSSKLAQGSAYWGVGEPNNFDGQEDCVHIDRRGATGNLNDESCETKLSSICEYTSKPESCDFVVKSPKEGYFVLPSLNECMNDDDDHKGMDDESDGTQLPLEEVICPENASPLSPFHVVCCPECKKEKKNRNFL